MATAKVTLVLDDGDAGLAYLTQGTAYIRPSQEIPDAADDMLIRRRRIPVQLKGTTPPSIQLVPCDAVGPQNTDGTPGWSYEVSYSAATPGAPDVANYVVLSTDGPTVRLSALTAMGRPEPGQKFVPLPTVAPTSTAQVLGLSSLVPLVPEWVNQTGGGGGGGTGTVTAVNGKTPDGAGHVTLAAADVGADATGAASSAQTAAQAYADTAKLAKSANLSDLASPATARTSLGLGSAATHPATDFDAAGAAAAAQAASDPAGTAAALVPPVVPQTITTASGSFAASKAITLLSVQFPVTGGYLRLYDSSAHAAADASRAEGTDTSAVAGLLYDFAGDTDNADTSPRTLFIGGATVFWNMSGTGPVSVSWLRQLAQ